MSDFVSSPGNQMQAYQQIYANPNTFNDLKQKAREDAQSALKPVAEQFEALFVSKILKEADKVKFDDGWLDGDQGKFYKDWYNQQMAQTVSAKGSLGLADMIVKQLSPKLPSVSAANYEATLEQKRHAASATTQQTTAQTSATEMPTTSDMLAMRKR
ncbi:MAG: rod-binding protein [Hydrogenovibrio sp.]|nr:rod-binding protein [Hydrogenovibrio sp.]